MAGFCVAMSVMIAFFKSPYLKIGGRIIAASRSDRRPDEIADAASARASATVADTDDVSARQ